MAALIVIPLALFYWWALPSVLNVAISYFLATKLCRHGLRKWLTFLFVSILLTFATRVPDFVSDILNVPDEVIEVKRTIRLGPSDTLNLQLDSDSVQWRSNYLATSGVYGFGAPSFGERWLRSAELAQSARIYGVTLNTGEPIPGHPTLRLKSSKTPTHTEILLEVISDDQVIAEYRRTIRLNFGDEVGSVGPNHHFLHLMKNTFWNSLAQVMQSSQAITPYEFMKRAITYSSDIKSSVELSSVLEQSEETVVWEDPVEHKKLPSDKRKFDCGSQPSTTMRASYSQVHIEAPTFQKELRLSKHAFPAIPRVRHGFSSIICGDDGYAALIHVAESPWRIVLFDKNWREQHVFEINLPVRDAIEGHKLLRHAFYQSDSELVLRYWVKPDRKKGTWDYPPTEEEKVVRISHSALYLDYGSLASRQYLKIEPGDDIPEDEQQANLSKAKPTPKDSVDRHPEAVSLAVAPALELYKTFNHGVPSSLSVLRLNNQIAKHAVLCDYSALDGGKNYILDCAKADESFVNGTLEKELKKRSSEIKLLPKRAPKAQKKNRKIRVVKSLDGLEKAQNTWGSALNPNNIFPLGRYYVAHINTRSPTKVIHSEIVDQVAVKYGLSSPQKIQSRDFGAYWAGRFRLDAPATRKISIDRSWAKVRVMINGLIVYEDGVKAPVFLNLNAGEYIVEVEYVNDSHTTSFTFGVHKDSRSFTRSEIVAELKRTLPQRHDYYYARIDKSRNEDNSETIDIGRSDYPVVLELSSMRSVHWKVSNPHKTELLAVIFGSTSSGSTIGGDIGETVLRYPTVKPRIRGYQRSLGKCHCADFGRDCKLFNGKHEKSKLVFTACE